MRKSETCFEIRDDTAKYEDNLEFCRFLYTDTISAGLSLERLQTLCLLGHTRNIFDLRELCEVRIVNEFVNYENFLQLYQWSAKNQHQFRIVFRRVKLFIGYRVNWIQKNNPELWNSFPSELQSIFLGYAIAGKWEEDTHEKEKCIIC
jgi:hypothetical protein